MPTWMAAGVRTGLQCLWGLLATWAADAGASVPQTPPAWLEALALAATMVLVTSMVHAMEARGGALGRLARLMMLGVPRPVVPRG